MALASAARRAIGKVIPSSNPRVETNKYGFRLRIDKPHGKWKEVIETWMPIFEEVGWLDGFAGMKISEGCVVGDGNVGNYSNCTINIEHDPAHYDKLIHQVVALSERAVLMHEMLHHAHLQVNDYTADSLAITSEESELLKEHVSQYSSTNRLEAVAEIGTGIALGYDFPEEIHEIYKKYDGPQEVYEISKMR